MPRHLHFTKFLSLSFALHALVIATALFLIKPQAPEIPVFTPVKIVDLPPQIDKQLPPVQQRPIPIPPPPVPSEPRSVIPEKRLPPGAGTVPKKFGTGDEIKLPKTLPRTGLPEGAEQGKETGGTGTKLGQESPPSRQQTGPLPFLSQNDIDELARKGMPEKKPGDDSVTLDTDEFKFISYNRWLEVKVNQLIRYPELAKVSGLQGILYIQFTIMKDGSLGPIDILKSSGYKILDDEIVNAIRNSAPFAPLPDDWHMDHYTIRGIGIFHLGEGYIR